MFSIFNCVVNQLLYIILNFYDFLLKYCLDLIFNKIPFILFIYFHNKNLKILNM
jgi:hypothetical protein